MTKHDPYLTQSIEALGRTTVIVALQKLGATFSAAARMEDNSTFAMRRINIQDSAWAYRQARILMGIED